LKVKLEDEDDSSAILLKVQYYGSKSSVLFYIYIIASSGRRRRRPLSTLPDFHSQWGRMTGSISTVGGGLPDTDIGQQNLLIIPPRAPRDEQETVLIDYDEDLEGDADQDVKVKMEGNENIPLLPGMSIDTLQ